MTDKYTLPRETCEWCGRDYVWVRRIMGGGSETIKLDPEPLDPSNPNAMYTRMSERETAGRVDCVKPCGTTNARCYSPHKQTCPQRGKWAGHKKWRVAAKVWDTQHTPELDRFPDPSDPITHLP